MTKIFMAKISGLALIQSTVSAIGLLLTNIIWDKWQKCCITKQNRTVLYRTGLWDKCIDHYLIHKTVCTPLAEEERTAKLKSVSALMISSLALQIVCVILGLLIYRYGKYRKTILIPLIINIAAALSGSVGLSIYTTEYDKVKCELSSSYIMGWFGIAEALICCLFFVLVALGK